MRGCKLTANFFTNPFQVQQLLQQEQLAHLLQRVLKHLPLQAPLQAFPDLEKTVSYKPYRTGDKNNSGNTKNPLESTSSGNVHPVFALQNLYIQCLGTFLASWKEFTGTLMEAPLSDSILRDAYRGYKSGAKNYRENTCVYNSAMDFTSMEVEINHHQKMVHSVSGYASIFTICSHYLSK